MAACRAAPKLPPTLPVTTSVQASSANTEPPQDTALPATPATETSYPAPAQSPTQPVLLPTVTPIPFTPLPPASIIGSHLVQPGETVFCIGRGYGVLPAAIIQDNGLPAPGIVYPGQVLRIPLVQWLNIPNGPVCAPQFSSPFPGLPPTSAATPIAAGPPLVLELEYLCVWNCGSADGTYTVHYVLRASGGVEPYVFNPAQSFDLSFSHCTDHSGSVSVTSADGQLASQAWTYHDVFYSPACIPPAYPGPGLP